MDEKQQKVKDRQEKKRRKSKTRRNLAQKQKVIQQRKKGKNARLAMALAALRVAAAEAYQNEVISSLMEENTIGEGNEYADKDDWLQSKISEWYEQAS